MFPYPFRTNTITGKMDLKFCYIVCQAPQLVRSPAWPILFPRIDDSHCNRVLSSLTTVPCFDNGFVGKQPVAWKEYCAEYWLKELKESMDRHTGHCGIAKILLKMVLNTIQSIILSMLH